MKRRAILAACCAIVLVASGCAGSERTRHPIEGTWVITSATLAGAPLPLSAFDGSKLYLDAGHYEFQSDRGDFTVFPGTRDIDLHGLDGPNAGRTILAIFALKGETLTVAYDLSGTARPTRFESAPGTRQFLVVYRRP